MDVNKKLKICLLTTTYPRHNEDWMGNYIHNLARELTSKFEVKVLAPGNFNSKEKEIMDNVKVKRFNYIINRLAYKYGIIDNIKENPLLLFLVPFFTLSYIKNAFSFSKDCEVINSHWMIPSGFIGALIKKFKGKKHILTIHSGGLHLLYLLPLRKTIAKFIINNSDHVITVSNDLKNKLLKLCPRAREKVKVIPMGIYLENNLDKDSLKEKYGFKDEKVILFLGRLNKIKGVNYLIEALKNFDDYVLLVAGDGLLKKELKELSNRLNVNSKFLGYVEKDKKDEVLSLSDVFVSPSIKLGRREEGLPVVILEAMSKGKAILATNTGGIGDAVKHGYNGLLIREKSSKDIADNLKILMNNDKLNSRMSKNSLKSAKRYNIKSITKRYMDLI